jgi:hypothetical protein
MELRALKDRGCAFAAAILYDRFAVQDSWDGYATCRN